MDHSSETLKGIFDLSGRVIIVTGGARGLGLTLAEALVEVGCGAVHCLDRDPPGEDFKAAVQRLGSKVKDASDRLKHDFIDVRDTQAVEKLIAGIADSHGRLDGLVAAAGIQQKLVPALEVPSETVSEVMDINFKGIYTVAVSCARQMIKHKCKSGSMVLIASMSGFIANRDFMSSVYNASKAAVIQLCRNLSMEWGHALDGGFPIRVNALCPGNILTPMVLAHFEEDSGLQARWESQNMLGRLSRPSEYRGAVIYMLSDASSFMTGSHMVIDGGYTAW